MKEMITYRMMVTALLFSVLLTGCAQKIPVNTGDNVGLIAIPMNSINQTIHSFAYSYELSSSTNDNIKIMLKPIVGRHFAFSEVLPSGSHVFDTITTYTTQTYRISTPFNKMTTPLSPPIKFTIEPGKILLPSTVLEVKNIPGDNESFYQSPQWKVLEKEEMDIYMELLRKMENIDSWQETPASNS